jgi:hypothetical protein
MTDDIDDEPEETSETAFFGRFDDALDMLVSGAVASSEQEDIDPSEVVKDVVTALVVHAYDFAASVMSQADAVALVAAILQTASEFYGKKARLDA